MALEQIGLLGNAFFTNIILPFVLVFTVVFAVLQKVKVLSDAKDVNAVVSMIFALTVVGVPAAVGVISNIIPVIAVFTIILFVWFMITGFATASGVNTSWPEGLKKLFQVILGLVLLSTIAWATGLFDYITVDKAVAAQYAQFAILIGAIIAVIAVVVGGAADGKKDKEH